MQESKIEQLRNKISDCINLLEILLPLYADDESPDADSLFSLHQFLTGDLSQIKLSKPLFSEATDFLLNSKKYDVQSCLTLIQEISHSLFEEPAFDDSATDACNNNNNSDSNPKRASVIPYKTPALFQAFDDVTEPLVKKLKWREDLNANFITIRNQLNTLTKKQRSDLEQLLNDLTIEGGLPYLQSKIAIFLKFLDSELQSARLSQQHTSPNQEALRLLEFFLQTFHDPEQDVSKLSWPLLRKKLDLVKDNFSEEKIILIENYTRNYQTYYSRNTDIDAKKIAETFIKANTQKIIRIIISAETILITNPSERSEEETTFNNLMIIYAQMLNHFKIYQGYMDAFVIAATKKKIHLNDPFLTKSIPTIYQLSLQQEHTVLNQLCHQMFPQLCQTSRKPEERTTFQIQAISDFMNTEDNEIIYQAFIGPFTEAFFSNDRAKLRELTLQICDVAFQSRHTHFANDCVGLLHRLRIQQEAQENSSDQNDNAHSKANLPSFQTEEAELSLNEVVQFLKLSMEQTKSPSNNPKNYVNYHYGDALIEAARLQLEDLVKDLLAHDPSLVNYSFYDKHQKQRITALRMALSQNNFDLGAVIIENGSFSDPETEWACEAVFQIRKNNISAFNFLTSYNIPPKLYPELILTGLETNVSCSLFETIVLAVKNDDSEALSAIINTPREDGQTFFWHAASSSLAKMNILASQAGANSNFFNYPGSPEEISYLDHALDSLQTAIHCRDKKLSPHLHRLNNLLIYGSSGNEKTLNKIRTIYHPNYLQSSKQKTPQQVLALDIEKFITECLIPNNFLGTRDLLVLFNALDNPDSLLHQALNFNEKYSKQISQLLSTTKNIISPPIPPQKVPGTLRANNFLTSHEFLLYLTDSKKTPEMLELFFRQLSTPNSGVSSLLATEINKPLEGNYSFMIAAKYSFAKMKVLARYGAHTHAPNPKNLASPLHKDRTYLDFALDFFHVPMREDKNARSHSTYMNMGTCLSHLLIYGCPSSNNSEQKLQALFSPNKYGELSSVNAILLDCVQEIITACKTQQGLLGIQDLIELKNLLQDQSTLLYKALSFNKYNLNPVQQFISSINAICYNDKTPKPATWSLTNETKTNEQEDTLERQSFQGMQAS